MRLMSKAGWILGIMMLAAPSAAPRAAAEAEAGSIVITFKDGRQQSIRLADIARIEFTSPAERMPASQARFLGQWKVGDGNGQTFIITLKPEGSAYKSLGTENGMWTATNGEVRIAWDDGWHDILCKVGAHYEKHAYSPGSSLSGSPSNVTDALYLESQ